MCIVTDAAWVVVVGRFEGLVTIFSGVGFRSMRAVRERFWTIDEPRTVDRGAIATHCPRPRGRGRSAKNESGETWKNAAAPARGV